MPPRHLRQGLRPSRGPTRRPVRVCRSGPGENEAHSSRPFHPEAQAGWKLTQWLYQAHLQRTEIAIGNVIQCWKPKGYKQGQPFGNEDPTRQEIEWCWNAHVGPWLARWQEARSQAGHDHGHIIPVGVPAIKWLLGLDWKRGGERYAGTTLRASLPTLGENHAQ